MLALVASEQFIKVFNGARTKTNALSLTVLSPAVCTGEFSCNSPTHELLVREFIPGPLFSFPGSRERTYSFPGARE